MQITPLPTPPVQPNALPQDAVAKVVPHIQAQASAPLIQRAVDPTGRSDRNTKTRTNSEKAKGGASDTGGDDKRGGSVNIRV
jgi:hypothetical protein